MKEDELIKKLINYKNGSNFLLLLKVIEKQSNDSVCLLSNTELGNLIGKNRRFVAQGLKVLEELKLIKKYYKRIELGEEFE